MTILRSILKWLNRVFVGFAFVICFVLLATWLFQTPQESYWSDDRARIKGLSVDAMEAVGKPRAGAVIEGFADAKEKETYHENLCVIEFDEQGDYWDSKQLDTATRLIRRLDEHGEETPVLVFIHGWKNNADPRREDNDLPRFNRFLKEYTERRKIGTERKASPVGIYIGWRGLSLRGPLIKELSFPGRRAATSRIAGAALENCLWTIRRTANANQFDSRVVLIGHSFGGRILERVASPSVQNYYNSALPEIMDCYNALAELKKLVEEPESEKEENIDLAVAIRDLFKETPDITQIIDATEKSFKARNGKINAENLEKLKIALKATSLESEVKKAFARRFTLPGDPFAMRDKYLLGDLVLLINPATEALQARQLRLATMNWPNDFEPPAMISLTSETDAATGSIWTWGKKIETLITPTVPSIRRQFQIDSDGDNKPDDHESQAGFLQHTSGHDYRCLKAILKIENKELKDIEIPKKGRYLFYDCETPYKLPDGGYAAFRVGKDTLDKHSGLAATNGIFNPAMVDLSLKLLENTEGKRWDSKLKGRGDASLKSILQRSDSKDREYWASQATFRR